MKAWSVVNKKTGRIIKVNTNEHDWVMSENALAFCSKRSILYHVMTLEKDQEIKRVEIKVIDWGRQHESMGVNKQEDGETKKSMDRLQS